MTPEAPGGDARTLGHRGEFQPGDARVGVVEAHRRYGETAVSPHDDITLSRERAL